MGEFSFWPEAETEMVQARPAVKEMEQAAQT
jgi:hypothetical protein